MRRKEREVKETETIQQMLGEFKVCRLGLMDEGKVYVVPMNMGFDFDGKSLTLYFHCAKEGKKLDLIRENPSVGFEMDKEIALVEGDTPCQYSYSFMSIIGNGEAEIVEDAKEKSAALEKIMKQQSVKEFDTFRKNPKLAEAVAIIKVTAGEYTCKRNI